MSSELKIHKSTCRTYGDWMLEIAARGGDWLEKKKLDPAFDHDAFKRQIGESVKRTIANTPGESERRREVAKRSLNVWARSEAGRQRSSETAIKTSVRPEIQRARAEKLAKWRKENPEKFQVIIDKLTSSWKTKPELFLFKFCSELDPGFRHNFQILNKMFETTKTHRRQVDIYHPEKMVVVEFDGPYHFLDLKGSDLLNVKNKDQELNTVLSSSGYQVIRVSYDQFTYRRGGKFKQECLDSIKLILNSHKPGLYLIGELYAQNQKH